jgi:hypothetical protein
MKKEKKEYIDDGHTIYSMDCDAKWSEKRVDNQTIYVSKQERRALIKAAFLAYTPKLLMVLFCFGLAIVLIYLWLK